MPQRLDLDSLGGFIKNISAAGMPLFPNEEIEAWVRDSSEKDCISDLNFAVGRRCAPSPKGAE